MTTDSGIEATNPLRAVARTYLACIALVAALGSVFWIRAMNAWFPQYTYEQFRQKNAFSGLRIQELRGDLDRHLAISEPVMFSPKLKEESFFEQRVAEVIYPRRVQPHALVTIQLDGYDLIPTGIGERPNVTPDPAFQESLEIHWPTIGSALLSGLGWGVWFWLAVSLVFRRMKKTARYPGLGALILAGAAVLGSVAMLATATEGLTPDASSMPFYGLGWLGAAVGAGVGVLALRRSPGIVHRLGRFDLSLAAAWIALGCTLVRRVAVRSNLEWDGRSIWFFHAKQLFYSGKIPMSDLLSDSYAFSHPEYPLLLPQWVRHFMGPHGLYNERMGSFGIPVLFLAAVSAFYSIAARRFGKWGALSLAIATVLTWDGHALGGNADAFVLLALATAWLSLLESDFLLAAISLGAAATLKQEGLVFGLIVLVTWGLYARTWRPALGVGATILPGLAYQLWTKGLGIDTSGIGILRTGERLGIPELSIEILSRIPEGLSDLPIVLTSFRNNRFDLAWAVAILSLVFLLGTRKLRGPAPRAARAAWVGAGAIFALSFLITLSIVYHEVGYLMEHTMDRLSAHAVFLFTLGVFEAFRASMTAGPSTLGGKPA